ncbi:MAG: PIN domain-containing protein [Chloroflexi bacterium]|nr:PIN domain-containing protein [Chloroflexota bacterium]
MTIDRAAALFFDASLLFSAAHSPTSGSYFLVRACSKGYLQALVSPETERNLINKSTAEAFTRYRQMIASTPLSLVSAPAEMLVAQHEPVFFEDAHVVAAALASQAHYLITLDRRLAVRVRQSGLPVVAISPRDFIQSVLPDHPDYASIRGSSGQ